jgi:cytochrome c oxidase cbb3-type subunit 4
MDIADLRGLSTILCMAAFAAVVLWAYWPSHKKYFEQASELPFADESKKDEVK